MVATGQTVRKTVEGVDYDHTVQTIDGQKYIVPELLRRDRTMKTVYIVTVKIKR